LANAPRANVEDHNRDAARHHARKSMANAPRAKRPYRHRHNATRQRESDNVGSITSVLGPTVAKQ